MSARLSGRGLRLAGWLLTPAVVWAGSFVGGWIGAVVGGWVATASSGIVWLAAGAVLGGTAALFGWIARLRRGARLARAGRAAKDAAAEGS